ncbi:LADA_0C12794g1_1 [Lachancea dasiensis]|uniref:LADA_0C12794g1_1 n=1 Tax=Lachancea dasiensis TaxID=1072105 RepID=A0A1G4J2G0_9SACH|nr:LADA_0C12794g1_1 [Lachancea dasiensis]
MERSESALFSQLSNDQIQKIRDAFQFIDEDGDGRISKKDLVKMYSNLGKSQMEAQIDQMLASENNKELTFPEFLTLMGERLRNFPEDQEMSDALRAFNPSGGNELNVDVAELKSYLRDAGSDMTAIEAVLKQFCATQLSGEQIFKGQKFLDTIE